MSTNLYTVQQLAGLLGISPTQVYNELGSFPHQRTTEEGIIRFTEEDVTEVRAIRAAGPAEQLERYQLLAAKLDEVRALDETHDS
jgi:predicted DNA-binding transcriptional regulator AlpA